MKKVGSVNAPPTSGSGSSNTIVGGLPMQRGGSHGSRGMYKELSVLLLANADY
jgi:hypothetical protein